MTRIALEPVHSPDGWRFRLMRQSGLMRRAQPIPPAEWQPASPAPGVALLLAALRSGDAEIEGDAVVLPHAAAAGLSAGEAERLALPPVCPHSLHLERSRPITEAGFQIGMTWIAVDGVALAGVSREGTQLRSGTKSFLLLDPIRALLDAIDEVNHIAADCPDDMDARMAAFARLRRQLAAVTGDVQADEYLNSLVIHHATGLGIDIELRAGEDSFTPVLFGDGGEPKPDSDDDAPQREPLLPRAHAERFARDRFLRQGARPHYVIARGVYVVLDPPVTAALAVVERVNKADRETRAAFRRDPMSFLLPEIEGAGGDGSTVADMRGYGERVLGIGPWQRIKLSFRIPVSRNWLPDDDVEVFTLEPGGSKPLVVRREDVLALKKAVEAAEAARSPTFEFAGEAWPMSAATADTVRSLMGVVAPSAVPADPRPPPGEKPAVTAARTKDNEEELTYSATLNGSRRHLATGTNGLPLRRPPLQHQRDGIQWLQGAFLSGMPGVLLADDMGLGKTYQVLAFLLWLRIGMRSGGIRRPCLIVAPKTLLSVWEEQMAEHLGPDALGGVLRVFGSGVAALRTVRGGNDMVLASQTLDVDQFDVADIVLTTYETMRDYHLSFMRVRFAVSVYDEAQKIKNPGSLMNQGAKAQQADFSIVMTGTPIENGVIDLWTILDIAWPGFFHPMSGREFLKRYSEPDPERRTELKERLSEPARRGDKLLQPVMLRRFKAHTLKGLPARSIVPVREPMPEVQAQAYDAVRRGGDGRPGQALAALQRLRAVALHPCLTLPVRPDDHRAFVAASARFTALERILRDIAARGEKALVFIDLIEAQRALQVLLPEWFGLQNVPAVINGATAAPVRDRIRTEFQAGPPGFDVLLLGPKAAGFGLTLTAANNVIHLNRWWNPAVEDQCNDRVYRIGQERDVTVWIPLAVHPRLGDESYDLILHGLLEEKRALSSEIVVPTQFTETDFRRLYEKSFGRSGGGCPEEVDRMDWLSFERWTAGALRAAGMSVNETPRTGDKGADLLATGRNGDRWIVQCKHRACGEDRTVDDSAVQEVAVARFAYPDFRDASLAAVTNGTFELAARRLAVETGVLLVDRPSVADVGRILAEHGTPA